MPIEVILPKVDMDMASGTIAGWHKSEGDLVQEGDALFDIETDKATMEVESPGTGTLHFISARDGDEVPIGQSVAWLFAEGEEIISPEISKEPREITAAFEAPRPMPDQSAGEIPKPYAASQKIRATPLARQIAKTLNVSLSAVNGSGPRGRVTRADVEKAAQQAPEIGRVRTYDVSGKTGAQKTADDLGLSYSLVPVSKMRSVIATRLTESKSTVPHFYLNADIALDALLAMREQINLAGEVTGAKKISVNDLLVKACAEALMADQTQTRLGTAITLSSLTTHISRWPYPSREVWSHQSCEMLRPKA